MQDPFSTCAHFRDAETKTHRVQSTHPARHTPGLCDSKGHIHFTYRVAGSRGSFYLLCSLPVGQWLAIPAALGITRTPTLPAPVYTGATL